MTSHSLHLPFSLHQSMPYHPSYSYANYRHFEVFTNNTFTPMPSAISTTTSFLHFSSKLYQSIHLTFHYNSHFHSQNSPQHRHNNRITTLFNHISTHPPTHIIQNPFPQAIFKSPAHFLSITFLSIPVHFPVPISITISTNQQQPKSKSHYQETFTPIQTTRPTLTPIHSFPYQLLTLNLQ